MNKFIWQTPQQWLNHAQLRFMKQKKKAFNNIIPETWAGYNIAAVYDAMTCSIFYGQMSFLMPIILLQTARMNLLQLYQCCYFILPTQDYVKFAIQECNPCLVDMNSKQEQHFNQPSEQTPRCVHDCLLILTLCWINYNADISGITSIEMTELKCQSDI